MRLRGRARREVSVLVTIAYPAGCYDHLSLVELVRQSLGREPLIEVEVRKLDADEVEKLNADEAT